MTMRREEVSRVKNIQSIVLGAYQLDTWYFSPYPAPFSYADTIYICEYCLSYFDSRKRMSRHRAKCPLHHPPGNEIYRKDNISFFEVDGHKQRHYCRNLCLLSKLFLDHKTLYYDVNPFLFYVMTVNDELGCHIIGYFSKEKESADNYNVACILTLPSHQRKGYGKVLIAFSYELSKTEGKIGSPEKPLSDLGLLSYRSYWSEVLIDLLVQYPGDDVSIDDLSRITAFTVEDILHTLSLMNVIKIYKNNHIICLDKKALDTYDKNKSKKAKIDPSYLKWTPPMFTQSQLRYI